MVKSSVLVIWGCPFALTSLVMYLNYLRPLTHPAILLKIIAFLKPLTPFVQIPSSSFTERFETISYVPFTVTLRHFPQSFSIFTHPLIWIGSIPPFQFVSYFSFLPLLLEPSSINILLLSYSLSLPLWILPFMYVLVCRIFSQLCFTIKFPSLFSHLYPQTSWVVFHFNSTSWPPAIDHLPLLPLQSDFFCQHTTETAVLKTPSDALLRALPSPLQHCDTVTTGFFIFLISPTLVLDFLTSATVIVP